MLKKHFNKKLLIAKEDEDFENCGKCLNCDNAYVDGFDEVRDDCHVRKMLLLKLKFLKKLSVIAQIIMNYIQVIIWAHQP